MKSEFPSGLPCSGNSGGSEGSHKSEAPPPREAEPVEDETEKLGEKSMPAPKLPRGVPPPKSPRGRPDPRPTRPPKRPPSKIPEAFRSRPESRERFKPERGGTGNELCEAVALEPRRPGEDASRSDQADAPRAPPPEATPEEVEDGGKSSGAGTSPPIPAPRSDRPAIPRPPIPLPVPQRPMSRREEVAAAGPGADTTGGGEATAPTSAKEDMIPPREEGNPSPIGVGFRTGAAGSEEEEGTGAAPPGADFGTNSFARTDSSTAPLENCSKGDMSVPD